MDFNEDEMELELTVTAEHDGFWYHIRGADVDGVEFETTPSGPFVTFRDAKRAGRAYALEQISRLSRRKGVADDLRIL